MVLSQCLLKTPASLFKTIILEDGVTSHPKNRHICLGDLAYFSLFVMFNLGPCNLRKSL